MTIEEATERICSKLTDPTVHKAASGSVYIYADGKTIRVSNHRHRARARIAFDLRVDLDHCIRRPIYSADKIDAMLHDFESKSIDFGRMVG